ncbi:uncharacterized protein BDCG_16709 [Blastomyces dermatitidis ER-3]|uniref:Uncharacterized protein n=1 Tax=Ajellomyces dermatitidis (strain ER-3 / ATCC MYA-2586) TaxID=559297 RepID=A0ABX2VTY1_AJEDR|nr:uncharacterized protein BDCG_16709 [Blastomyces dermatitidis ER-3]OAT00643.1 hypothetical protein BDCG_16709 [Blastomyces dermatitidis ER-3]
MMFDRLITISFSPSQHEGIFGWSLFRRASRLHHFCMGCNRNGTRSRLAGHRNAPSLWVVLYLLCYPMPAGAIRVVVWPFERRTCFKAQKIVLIFTHGGGAA